MKIESSYPHSDQADYSLSHLTLLDCSVPELIFIASRTGYDAVSPRLIPMGVQGEFFCPPLDKKLIQATRCAMDITGIGIHDIELLRITENCDVKNFEAAIAAGAELGARKLTASVWSNRRDDHHDIVDTYAALCELAGNYGLSVALEFPTFSRLKDLSETVEVVKAAECDNGGILIDTLYVHLSRLDPVDLEGLPPEWFSFIQICDIPPGIPDNEEGMIHLARNFRLYPGEGAINFAAILDRLPPLNFSIELPNTNRVAELGYEEHARRCLQASKRLIKQLSNEQTSTH